MSTVRIMPVLLLCTVFANAQTTTPTAPTTGNTAATPVAPKALTSFDVSSIDKTADPCTDFFDYACGNWRKNNPIPGDQARWGRFNELTERNRYLLYTSLKQAAESPQTPLQKKYGDFYAACMDEKSANEKGAAPIEPILKQIADWNDKHALAGLVGQLQMQGVSAFFRFGSEQDAKDSTKQIAAALQGGLSLPDRDYYLAPDARSEKIRGQYRDYVVSIFKLLGDSEEKATAEAKNVLDIETALAKDSQARRDMRDPEKVYHPTPVAQLKTLAPSFDWDAYFTGIHLASVSSLNVGSPDFLKGMSALIDSTSLDALKSYLRFHVANGAAPYLSAPFVDASFGFFQHDLIGQAEQTARWKRCTSLTDRSLGEAVGQDWVKQNFPPDAKANMEKLVDALRKALAEDIQSLPWMTDVTKKQAEAKLDAFRQKIGYPESWRDYSSLEVKRDDLVGNIQRSNTFEFARDLNKIGKPVDEKEWGMTPPTVNAYYDPSMNDINFPAGILQPPFFDKSKDPAVNFGAIGVVIGHEMTHGFDDQGSRYDGQGNLRNWWSEADRKAFDERTDCEVKEYGNFEPVPEQKLDGKLTLGENAADNGGIQIAYKALLATMAEDGAKADEKLDGYTPQQRFFISFAQVWCENRTDQASRVAAKVDPHSPGRFRVNGTVQNIEEFGKAFNCKKGQPMYPTNSCRVW